MCTCRPGYQGDGQSCNGMVRACMVKLVNSVHNIRVSDNCSQRNPIMISHRCIVSILTTSFPSFLYLFLVVVYNSHTLQEQSFWLIMNITSKAIKY